jgi:hypothetical protein
MIDLPKLNLPEAQIEMKEINQQLLLFDRFRRMWVEYGPEEFVRQSFLIMLTQFYGYPAGLISVESGIKVNKMKKRTDSVVYNRNGEAAVLIEFKAPDVKLDEKVLLQISNYQQVIKSGYLIISNGIQHHCLKINAEPEGMKWLDAIPRFEEL